jgi:acyl-CoA thioester hydrolase
LRYGESVLIETKYVHDDAAKIIFAYKVMNAKKPDEIIATANSIQVFLDLKGELILTNPPFYVEWKKKFAV